MSKKQTTTDPTWQAVGNTPPPSPHSTAPVKVIGREVWQEFHVHITEFQVVWNAGPNPGPFLWEVPQWALYILGAPFLSLVA